MHIHTHTQTHTHAHTQTHTPRHTYPCIHTCMHTHTDTHTHPCTHTNTYTNTHSPSVWGSELCTGSLAPSPAQALNPRDLAGDYCLQGTARCLAMPLGPLAPVTDTAFHSLSLPSAESCVAISHLGQHPKLLVFCLNSTPTVT